MTQVVHPPVIGNAQWRRVLAWSCVGLLVLVLATVTILLNSLRTQHIISVQSCAREGTFPGSDQLCRLALYQFHPTPEEVREMNEKAGAAWAFMMKGEGEARQLLRHYIAAGVELDAVDQRYPQVRWNALHLLALEPNARGVRLLLEAGARADIRDANGRTALDLARQRAERSPEDPGYAKVIDVLEAPWQVR